MLLHEVVIGRISVHSDYAARVALFRFLLLSSSDCHRGPKEVFVPALVASRGAVRAQERSKLQQYQWSCQAIRSLRDRQPASSTGCPDKFLDNYCHLH